jgi:hypothetical protein
MFRRLACRVRLHEWGPITGKDGGSRDCLACGKSQLRPLQRFAGGATHHSHNAAPTDWSGAGKSRGYPSKGSISGSMG